MGSTTVSSPPRPFEHAHLQWLQQHCLVELRADADPLCNPAVQAGVLAGDMWRTGKWGGGEGLEEWLLARPFAPPHVPTVLALGPLSSAVIMHHTAGLTHGGDVLVRISSQSVPHLTGAESWPAPFAYVVHSSHDGHACVVSAHIMPHLYAAVAERVDAISDGGHSRRAAAVRAAAATLRRFYGNPCPHLDDAEQACAISDALLAVQPMHIEFDWLLSGGAPRHLPATTFTSRIPLEWRAHIPHWQAQLPMPGDPPIVASGAWDAADVLSQRRWSQLGLWATVQTWLSDSEGVTNALAQQQAAYDSSIGGEVGLSFLCCLYDEALAPLAVHPSLARYIHTVASADGRAHDWTSVAARIRRALQLDISFFFPPTGPWHDPMAVRRQERSAEGDTDWMLELAKPRSDDALAMMRSLPRALMVANPLVTAVEAFAALPAGSKPLPNPQTLVPAHQEWHGCADQPACEHLDMLLSIVYALRLPVYDDFDPEPQRPVTTAPTHPGYGDLHTALGKAVAQGVYEVVSLSDVDERFEASIFCVPKRKPKLNDGMIGAAGRMLDGDQAQLAELHRLAAESAAGWTATARLDLASSSHFEKAMSLITEVDSWRAVFDGRKQGTLADMSGLSMRMGSLSSLLAVLQDGDGVGIADVAGGFHHVQLAPESRRQVWFRFEGRVYRAVRLPFGLTVSPFIFCCLSAEMRAILLHRGVKVALTFVDDFLFTARLGLGRSSSIIRSTFAELNVGLAEDKCKEAAEQQRALGIMVSTSRRLACLPADRLALLHVYLHILKQADAGSGARLPSHFIRHVCGKLGHLASVTRGAAAFMGPLNHLRAEMDARGYDWVEPHRLSSQLHLTIDFFLTSYGSRGTSLRLDRPLGPISVAAPGCIASDASAKDPVTGAGGYFGGISSDRRAIWGCFHPAFASESTALLELYAMACCVMHFAKPGQCFHLLTDSSAAAAIMNRGRSGSGCAHTTRLLNCFHLWLNQHSIDVHAVYAPRQLLTEPDAITEATSLAGARSLHLRCPRSGAPLVIAEAAGIAVDERGCACLRSPGGGAGASPAAAHPAWIN